MPQTFTSTTTFPYPFIPTVRGVWYKYPNPFASHVVSVDILDQSLCPHTGQLRTERILGVSQNAPKWATRLLGASDETYVREVVLIDPITQKLEMTSTNLSLSQYLLVKEYITYRPTRVSASSSPLANGHRPPSPPRASAGARHTTFDQTALIECRGLPGLAARKVEEWSLTRFGENADRGRQGLLSVLAGMYGAEREAVGAV